MDDIYRRVANEPSETYCANAWVQIRIARGSTVAPCCEFSGPFAPIKAGQNLSSALHDDYFQDLRKKMLVGERVPGCDGCLKKENGGGSVSMRKEFNTRYPGAWLNPPRLSYLEYNLGTLCNLACRGCNSSASSKWLQHEPLLGRKSHPQLRADPTLLRDSWQHLDYIKLIGGEPLLYQKEHEQFLTDLANNSDLANMTLEYATNGTFRVSQTVLDVWAQLKHLRLTLSVDGLGKNNDYFRHGSRWDDFVANAHWFQENVKTRSTHLVFHTVVSIYNIHEIIELDHWLTRQFPRFTLSKDYLSDPNWLDLRTLPPEDRKPLIDLFRREKTNPLLSDVVAMQYGYLEQLLSEPAPTDFKTFFSEESRVNTLLGYRLEEYHPHLAQIAKRLRCGGEA